MNAYHQIIKISLIVLLSFQLTACGTILYPERRNQSAGRIDVGVALLDGIWLLVGIIPGLIAFGVDFSTGAIYLPKSGLSNLESGEYKMVRFNPNKTSRHELENLISKETGQDFHFSDERYNMTRMNNKDEIIAHFKSL